MIDQFKHHHRPLPSQRLHHCTSRMCEIQALAKEKRLVQDNAHVVRHGFTTTLARNQPFVLSLQSFAEAPHRRETLCKAAKEEGSIRSQKFENCACDASPLCCMTSQHMAAPRVVVAHPVPAANCPVQRFGGKANDRLRRPAQALRSWSQRSGNHW